MAAIFDTFLYCIPKLVTPFTATQFFLTEGVLRSAKAMTQVRKPGGYGRVERYVCSCRFFLPYSILRMVCYHVLLIFYYYPSNLILCVHVP